MNAWEKVLAHIEPRLNPQTFATWFRPTQLEAVKENLLTVRVPNALFQKWLATEGAPSVAEALAALDLAYRVEYVPTPDPVAAATGARPEPAKPQQARLDFDSTDYKLNPR